MGIAALGLWGCVHQWWWDACSGAVSISRTGRGGQWVSMDIGGFVATRSMEVQLHLNTRELMWLLYCTWGSLRGTKCIAARGDSFREGICSRQPSWAGQQGRHEAAYSARRKAQQLLTSTDPYQRHPTHLALIQAPGPPNTRPQQIFLAWESSLWAARI